MLSKLQPKMHSYLLKHGIYINFYIYLVERNQIHIFIIFHQMHVNVHARTECVGIILTLLVFFMCNYIMFTVSSFIISADLLDWAVYEALVSSVMKMYCTIQHQVPKLRLHQSALYTFPAMLKSLSRSFNELSYSLMPLLLDSKNECCCLQNVRGSD